jgi:hypothetical protein
VRRKEKARAVTAAGPWPVQLRFQTGLTSEDYVSRKAWREASLSRCPNHPRGGCSLARHGTYERKTPAGTRIARWYCPESHTTFSLLPDFLAARLPGTLNALEDVVAVAEQAPSLEAAANSLRLDIELPGALRWIRRRIALVHRCLVLVIGLLPDQLAGCVATVTHLREHLGHESVLMALRRLDSCLNCRRRWGSVPWQPDAVIPPWLSNNPWGLIRRVFSRSFSSPGPKGS